MSAKRIYRLALLSGMSLFPAVAFTSPPAPEAPAIPATPVTAADAAPANAAAAETARAAGKPITTEINPGKMINYKSGNRDIQAYEVTPKLPGNPSLADSPAVVLVHDIFGMTDFIKAQADGLARQGYTVLVPNLYTRVGNADKGLDANAAWVAYEKTPDQQVMRDLSAAIDYLQGPVPEGQLPERPIGIVGHDMGGIYAMMMAGGDIRVTCAVNYYGRILYASTSPDRPASPVESLFNLRAPLLNFYGAIDPQIPDKQIAAMESRLSRNLSRTYYEIVRYPNVGHSFLVPTRPGYNAEAAQKTIEKTRDFLARYLRAEKPRQE